MSVRKVILVKATPKKEQKGRKREEVKEKKERVTEISPTVSGGWKISKENIIGDIRETCEEISEALHESEIRITRLLESWELFTIAGIIPSDPTDETFEKWSKIKENISFLEKLFQGTKNSYVKLHSMIEGFIESLQSRQE
ncbi:MAG: hypothetical protein QW687_04455 [Candidatus Hadarchaeales archaeon]